MKKSVMAVLVMVIMILVGCNKQDSITNEWQRKSETLSDKTFYLSGQETIDVGSNGSVDSINITVDVRENGPISLYAYSTYPSFNVYEEENAYSLSCHIPLGDIDGIQIVNLGQSNCKVYWQVIHTWWE